VKEDPERVQQKQALLSFDIEEFDVPAEHGIDLALDDQIRLSREGTEQILALLDKYKIKATFFTTITFAQRARPLISRILASGHELASHGWYHSKFAISHLEQSRAALKEMFGVEVTGFRMARMMHVDSEAIRDAGYRYNSSLNPVYLPGRYNNFSAPRTAFEKNGLFHLPASATPYLRIPLFWLSFHHLPTWLYKAACARTIRRDGYLNLYFHPWEFVDLSQVPGLPWLITRRSGEEMMDRFDELLRWMLDRGYEFKTIEDFVQRSQQSTRIHDFRNVTSKR
jgi:peptidoglycan/xylan/chitin deacetylase (PgdA/CDA1 family)